MSVYDDRRLAELVEDQDIAALDQAIEDGKFGLMDVYHMALSQQSIPVIRRLVQMPDADFTAMFLDALEEGNVKAADLLYLSGATVDEQDAITAAGSSGDADALEYTLLLPEVYREFNIEKLRKLNMSRYSDAEQYVPPSLIKILYDDRNVLVNVLRHALSQDDMRLVPVLFPLFKPSVRYSSLVEYALPNVSADVIRYVIKRYLNRHHVAGTTKSEFAGKLFKTTVDRNYTPTLYPIIGDYIFVQRKVHKLLPYAVKHDSAPAVEYLLSNDKVAKNARYGKLIDDARSDAVVTLLEDARDRVSR